MDDEVVLIPHDDGTKRRLPLWMIGVAAADRVRNSKEENGNVISNVKEGIVSRILPPKSKQTRKGVSLSKEVDSCVLVKCERKKRGRKLIREEDEGGGDDEVAETAADKKTSNRVGKKGQKSSRGKRGVADGLSRESSEEIETLSPEEDGVLTVDDLMSIAQEYITTDKQTEQQQSLHTEQDVERQLSPISFSGREPGGLPSAPHSSWKSPGHEEMVSVHNSVGTSAGEGTVVNPCSTGDPAQDMLDLLLGPLLKKPGWEENKIGLIKEDMTFAGDITKQRQNNIGTEVVVPLTKKKSSLKDKVAMFLD
ncbi:hypothetical protein RHSIM_Rhsim02G0032700 [Rhododendron simsii]|uniref:Uncharacterized protein n=1 Tax=Rhododendron simsii TaxID=118357 RepID=A0A834LZI2_RHOSS|nr:hypothetical protein RHSIM_Rhsim02G0032700 [Rhododendron simsii]